MFSPFVSFLVASTVGAGVLGSSGDPGDLRAQFAEAAERAVAAARRASSLRRDGRSEEAAAAVLASFPEAKRTPVQMLALGDVLFRHEPGRSYELHKLAAAKLPEFADAQLQWGLEQHRAKQYEGALAAYARSTAARPEYAPVFGLAAECLIRAGKVREASEAWRRFERGKEGSIQALEALVCALHSGEPPDRRRATLMAAAAKGDIDAAEKLIVLDCEWRPDWWNGGPNAEYLRHDLGLVAGSPIAPSARREAMLCAGELWLARAGDVDDSVEILARRGFVLDPSGTLPESGAVLASVLSAALEGGAISRPDAARRFGDRILEMGARSKDAGMYRAAGKLFTGSTRLNEVDKLGWETTGDERLAAAYIVGRFEADEAFSFRSASLARALRQFPENSEIAHVALLLAKKEGRPIGPYLVAAIKAEYTHFSASRGLEPRPSSRALRMYFGMLAKELEGGVGGVGGVGGAEGAAVRGK
jgi:tetratricopeptide (TPR) repeat protein